jgi:hypothetical protein
MNCLIDCSGELADSLKKQGRKYVFPKNRSLGISIHANGKDAVVIVPSIKFRPSRKINTVGDFFKSLIDEISKHHNRFVSQVFIQGGGSIPIPKDFLDWCQERNIKVTVFTQDDRPFDKITR